MVLDFFSGWSREECGFVNTVWVSSCSLESRTVDLVKVQLSKPLTVVLNVLHVSA